MAPDVGVDSENGRIVCVTVEITGVGLEERLRGVNFWTQQPKIVVLVTFQRTLTQNRSGELDRSVVLFV